MSEREQKALKTVNHYKWWAVGASLIPVSFVDLAAVSGAHLKMLAEISKQYEVQFDKSRGKAVIGSLLGSVVPGTIACTVVGSLAKAVPGVGSVVGATTMAVTSGAAAVALGKVFIQHFESGGTFLDFNPDKVREYFWAQFEESQRAGTAQNPA